MIPGTALYTKEKTLFYAECKLGDLNANWIPILSVSIFASYNFTPLLLESVFQGYINIINVGKHLPSNTFLQFFQ